MKSAGSACILWLLLLVRCNFIMANQQECLGLYDSNQLILDQLIGSHISQADTCL